MCIRQNISIIALINMKDVSDQLFGNLLWLEEI